MIAFSTASAPVLTTKWRGVPAGAMRFSSALRRSDSDGLILGVRVARRHERQRLEDRADHGRIVLAERLRGDERAHVEEAVRLAGRVAIDDGEVRPDGLGRIERDRQREEQAARGGLERGVRRRQVLFDQRVERPVRVGERVGHVHVHEAGAILLVQLVDAFERCRSLRHRGVECVGHFQSAVSSQQSSQSVSGLSPTCYRSGRPGERG